MELKDYGRIIVQRGWIVVLAAVLTAGSAFLWSRSQPPEYRATAIVLVRADSLDFGRLQASKQILASFSQRIRSEDMAFRVVDQLQLDQNPYDILANLAVSSDQNDLTIQIDATSQDPTVAGQIANGFAEEFIRVIEDSNTVQLREDQVLVDLLQRAGAGAQTAPNTRINTIAGAVFGILLGGIIVLLLELLDDTIKTKEDVERYIGRDLFFLGQVPPK
jgi:polysaccharide biosynthesis transport protein